MIKTRTDLSTISSVAQLLAVVLMVTALFFARDVFIPLALGLLLSFLLSPIVNWLQRLRIPNVIAVVMTAALTFLILAGGFTLLGRELTSLVGELPQHKDELIAKARSISGMTTGVGGSLDKLANEMSEVMVKSEDQANSEAVTSEASEQTAFQEWTNKLFPANANAEAKLLPNNGASAKTPLYVKSVQDDLPLASWAMTAGTVLGPLATAGLVTVFALFMLIHREDLRDRIIAVVSHGNYVTTTEAMDEAAHRISRYLIAQTIINTSYGFVLTIGLVVIGLTMTEEGVFPNAILWGVLAACLRFVPYLGPTAAAIFPSAIALSVFPGYGVFVAVVAMIAIMELSCNNIFEPWLYGSSTGISAVAVIMAALFWGWLWGPVGLLLSTPLTVCLVVLGRYVPRFKMFSTLLGEDVEIKESMRFYQRLLASDERRAGQMLSEHIAQNDFDKTCDEVLIPALKHIRSDHDAEHLSDSDANRLFAIVGGLIAEIKSSQSRQTLDEDADSDPNSIESDCEGLVRIIGCTSHHLSETLVLNLLRVSGEGIYEIDTFEDDIMPLEIAHQIASENPPVVVIVVLPKGGFAQARYLCKSIRSEGYSGSVVIACLGKFKNYDNLFIKFRKNGATSMTTSYSQTRSKIESILKRSDRPKPLMTGASAVIA